MGVVLLMLVLAWEVGFGLRLGFGAGGVFVLSMVGVAVVLLGGAATKPGLYIGHTALLPARWWPGRLGLCIAVVLPFVAAATFR